MGEVIHKMVLHMRYKGSLSERVGRSRRTLTLRRGRAAIPVLGQFAFCVVAQRGPRVDGVVLLGHGRLTVVLAGRCNAVVLGERAVKEAELGLDLMDRCSIKKAIYTNAARQWT